MSHEPILVVDDDPAVLDIVGYALGAEGFEVRLVPDGHAALQAVATEPPALVVLDVMLPGISGIEVCRRIRANSAVPILMLTARDAELDLVMGLEVGADDYITKPFSIPELVGRVRAALRRRELDRAESANPIREVGPLRVDLARHEVRVDGVRVNLTPSEFRLVAHLSEHPGRVLSRRQLMERLSDTPFFGDDRACDVHVCNVRRKIEADPGRPVLLVTVRSAGYKLADPMDG